MQASAPHSSRPPFGHLILLVFEAVMEVVCVSFPGYIVARQGMFNAEMQKFAANLNVVLFTPCLIFTKLASQLTAEKLPELAVIPVIFAVQTLVSYLCAIGVSKLFGFKKRPRNFVVAMGVFGNSNSLPISLVISLSKTIDGLHWNKIPGDNDGEVAARGILYLLIFQQLGQLVRWSWGYHVLLAPPDKFKDESAHENSQLEQGFEPYTDVPDEERQRLIDDTANENPIDDGEAVHDESSDEHRRAKRSTSSSSGEDGEQTPITHQQYTSSVSSKTSSYQYANARSEEPPGLLPTPANGNIAPSAPGRHITSFPSIKSPDSTNDEPSPGGAKSWIHRGKAKMSRAWCSMFRRARDASQSTITSLPNPVRKLLYFLGRFWLGVWDFMNPPLWAMLAAIIIASIPSAQALFFSDGTFVKNSITSAIHQMGGVAVPLILVVLGANLEGKTQPEDPNHSQEDEKEETKLLIACIASRMLLPIIIMAPLLALAAKYVPVSILDDPIFVVVCFLLTGAPSALQLAQICQINGVYLGVMSRLLFQSYVVWILPSTLILVICSIEVLQRAK
ncbi:MAG: hypothetical protein L6R38_006606 [Xanthoria sp. 2 TBL-2021]|nr:MAG: hypothetical protein L6R38_006606 [Xanthoria sp. 2 TBL-2021]